MKRTITLLAAAFAAAICNAAVPSPVPLFPAIPEMPAEFTAARADVLKSAAKATPQAYPDADTVLLDDRIHTKYEPDGTYVEWDEEWVKILTESGKKSLNTVDMRFSQRYGDAMVLACQVISPDGTVRDIPCGTNNVSVSTDNSSMSMNIYDPLDKNLTLAVPGLEVGDIRRVVTCRRSLKPRARDFWGDIAVLEYTQPIFATTVTIDAPEARLPKTVKLAHPVAGTVTEHKSRKLPGGRRLYKWQARDIPQVHPEPDSAPLYTQVQALRMSTATDWNEISTWYWKLSKPHLDKITPEITAKVKELVAGIKDRDAKIRKIYDFVSQEIRYMGLTTEDTAPGYEPHDVDITFKNRYGVCRDKAALLVAMLREAGIPAFPVLIHAGAKLDKDVPLPFFNHAITAVENTEPGAKGAARYILMDSTDESSSDLLPAYLSNRSFLVAREGGETLLVSPTPPASRNGLYVDSEGSVSPDGSLFLRTKIRANGMNDNIYRGGLLRMTPEKRRMLFEKILSAVSPGSELLSMKIVPENLRDMSKPLEIDVTAKIKCAVLRGETEDRLTVPFFSGALGFANYIFRDNTSLPKRRFTLETSATTESRETVRIDTSGILGKVRSLPAPAKAGTADGGFSFSLVYGCTNGVLSAERTWTSAAVEFPPETYQDLKKALAAGQTAARAKPLFRKKAGEDSDLRIVRSMSTVNLSSPYSWVQTNTVTELVMTYNGKKNSAEFNVNYNPAYKDVKVVSAVVKNRDGTVHTLKPHEIHLMDAGWNGSAPRYSPGKIMVVTLPGVEIGSLIDITTASTVTNSPAPFAIGRVFDSANPVAYTKLSVSAPAAIPLSLRENGVTARISTNENGTVDYVWEMRDLRPVPPEQAIPPAMECRPSVQITLPRKYAEETARRVNGFLASARAKAGPETRRFAKEFAAGASGPMETAQAIRNGLRKRVRLAGPSLWKLPAEQRNFASPEDVLKDGYANTVDYVNTLAALLERAGFAVDFVLDAGDSASLETSREAIRRFQDVTDFSSPVLRVRPGRNWLWPFKTRPEWYIGAQNEYTPIDTCGYAGDSMLDLAKCRIYTLEDVPESAKSSGASEWTIDVQPDGTAIFANTELLSGPGVGSFRKKWSEILPENRRREHAAILTGLSREAVAAGPLSADTNSYPAKISWSAKAANYAVVDGDTISVALPSDPDRAFGIGEGERKMPILVGKNETPLKETFIVTLPEGWTEIEHLPESFTLSLPGKDGGFTKFRTVTKTEIKPGKSGAPQLVVTIQREYPAQKSGPMILEAGSAGVLQAWNRRMADPALRTIIVRKRK